MDETKLGPCFADAQGNGMKKATEAWNRRASMGDFISREAALKAFENADADVMEDYGDGTSDWGFGRENIREILNSVPTADVVPVRYGRWECVYDDSTGETDITCSHCKNTRTVNGCFVSTDGKSCYFEDDYCPDCGSKMDLEGKTDN